MLEPLVERHRSRFRQLGRKGDAGFAAPGLYEFCEKDRITYFIRLPINNVLKKLVAPHLKRPTGTAPESGVQVKVIGFEYQEGSRDKPRRVVGKLEWRPGERFPRTGLIVINSRLEAKPVMLVYNGRTEISI